MKYIGSFFRINSMSLEEIQCQLLFLSRESLKHILLESKCGVPISQKALKKNFTKDDYNKLKEFTPLLSLYKKAKPVIYLSQNSKCWDESTFKKEIDINSNALLTLSLIKLSTYYEKFKNIDNTLFKLSKTYKKICKIQLDFYYKNLRNKEGFFICKKNVSTTNSSYPELTDKTSKISFAEQGYMMVAYYLYAINCDDNEDKNNFKEFSLEILDMLDYFKDKIYESDLEECCHLTYALNLMYKYSKNDKCKELLIDLCDFILSKHLELGINSKDISTTALTALNSYLCYKNTSISLFKENFIDICKSFKNTFNSDMSIFTKPGDKKEIKYYNIELILYLVNLMIYNRDIEKDSELESIICQYYKNAILSSSILTSFPEAPSIDSAERYKNFSMRSEDLLEDSMFKCADIPTPSLTALAPIFVKNQSYSKKKKAFSSSSKTSFESFNNMFIFNVLIEMFNDDYIKFIFPIKPINLINPVAPIKNIKSQETQATLNEQETQPTLSEVVNSNLNRLRGSDDITLTDDNSNLNDFIEINEFDSTTNSSDIINNFLDNDIDSDDTNDFDDLN